MGDVVDLSGHPATPDSLRERIERCDAAAEHGRLMAAALPDHMADHRATMASFEATRARYACQPTRSRPDYATELSEALANIGRLTDG